MAIVLVAHNLALASRPRSAARTPLHLVAFGQEARQEGGGGVFQASFEALTRRQPHWGRIAVLPWDTRTFGFGVGQYEAGDSLCVASEAAGFRESLAAWATANEVELVSCSIPATDTHWCALLQDLGFSFVDYALRITQPRLQSWRPRGGKPGAVRLAQPADQSSVATIAQHAFRVGRYHMDPRFPRRLSELRYEQWVNNAFCASNDQSRLYVTGEVQQATSFFHVDLVDPHEAHITLIAVDRDHQGGSTAIDLCTGALIDLRSMGVRRMTSKISAVNCPVMNVAGFFGWKYSDPQAIFHWHAPDGAHLMPSCALRPAGLQAWMAAGSETQAQQPLEAG